MSLFKILETPDRQQTQLAYKVKYFPQSQLTPGALDLICWKKSAYMHKHTILAACTDDLNFLTIKGRVYKIVWAYNCVPTEQEWNGKSDSFLIKVELRCSPAIPEYAVAILNFELPFRTPSIKTIAD